jgi:transcriptional regulator with XRE-family HTH domain
METSQRQKEFGYRVRRRRMALGMIQKELAERLQMPQGHISRLEKGEFLSVRLETLAQLADLLQCSTDFLLGRTDDPDAGTLSPSPQPMKRQRSRKAATVAEEVGLCR